MERSPAGASKKGMVFNIQRFSVHDGPGIRTTVFLKGCPLHCPWCSNPESQDTHPNLMVRDITCKSCGACIPACPQGAIALKDTGRVVDRRKCDQCLLCVDACLYGSLNRCGSEMGVDEIVREVLQDRLFYKNSGGGVTLSGGEPLLQSRFAGALLAACRKEGLHTALETSGHVPWKQMQAVLKFVDLLLFDVKHLDSGEHKRTTGAANKIILKNLHKAAAVTSTWLRIPLIAGFNDSEEHIENIAKLARQIGARNISLLAYHQGGQSKKEQLGHPYTFHEGRAPGEEHVQRLKRLIERTGTPASIDK